MQYDLLYDEFKKEVPESVSYLSKKEMELDLDETDGPHVLFGLAVADYIRDLMVKERIPTLKKVAVFMERMEIDSDIHVAEVLEQSILEDLLCRNRELVKQYDFLWGPETKKAFRCVGQWL